MPKRLFSGIQPTGILHLGNVFGAINNWFKLQNKYESIFCIVDLHAITTPQNPKELRKNTINTAKALLALGIDPKRSVMFVQSQVPQHLELYWILNSITKVSELKLMTQYKDKSVKYGESKATAGLLNYPVLMASDILLYDTNVVPVGEDQKQHLEFARDLARRFNSIFGDTFVVPEPKIPDFGARIMGLDDPTKKMSKSASSPRNYISIMDSITDVKKKIMTAQTDSGKEIKYDPENKKGISNLLLIYSLVSGKSINYIEKKYYSKSYKEFKEDLADVVSLYLKEVQGKFNNIKDSEIKDILEKGKNKVSKIAEKKIKEVYKKVGLGI